MVSRLLGALAQLIYANWRLKLSESLKEQGFLPILSLWPKGECGLIGSFDGWANFHGDIVDYSRYKIPWFVKTKVETAIFVPETPPSSEVPSFPKEYEAPDPVLLTKKNQSELGLLEINQFLEEATVLVLTEAPELIAKNGSPLWRLDLHTRVDGQTRPLILVAKSEDLSDSGLLSRTFEFHKQAIRSAGRALTGQLITTLTK